MKKIFLLLVLAGLSFSTRFVYADDSAGSKKLDEVLRNQKEILQKLDEIKSELQVVKVRASSR